MMHFRSLMVCYPRNRTYDTNGLGLYTADIKALRPFAKAVDSPQFMADLREPDILMVGEDHFRNAGRQFIIELLPKLWSAGYTHLAIELFPLDKRHLLDAFEENKTGAEAALHNYLSDQAEFGMVAEVADEYLAVLKACRDAAIKLEPLHHPASLEPVHARFKEIHPLFEDDLDICFRDIFMCLTLEKIFRKNPNARVVSLLGLAHTDANSGMPMIMREEFQRRSLSVAVCQREDVEEKLLIEAKGEALSKIPVYSTLNYSGRDPLPKPGDWVLFAPSKQ